MKHIGKTLMVIVTEKSLEHIIIHDLEDLGVNAYTIIEAKGKGDSGVKAGIWEHDTNIKIDMIIDSDMCKKVYDLFDNNPKYKHYSKLIYTTDVVVHD